MDSTGSRISGFGGLLAIQFSNVMPALDHKSHLCCHAGAAKRGGIRWWTHASQRRLKRSARRPRPHGEQQVAAIMTRLHNVVNGIDFRPEFCASKVAENPQMRAGLARRTRVNASKWL